MNNIILSPILTLDLIQCKIYPELIGTTCMLGPRRSFYKFWEKLNGPIPKGMFLCHKCDNIYGYCRNPKHIFLGSPKDNIQDCCNKKRIHGKYSDEVRQNKKGKLLTKETKQKVSLGVKRYYVENIDAKLNTSKTTQLSIYDNKGNVKRKYANKLGIQNICLKNNKFQVNATKNLNNDNEVSDLLLRLSKFDSHLKIRTPKQQFQISVFKTFQSLNSAINFKNNLLPIIHKI